MRWVAGGGKGRRSTGRETFTGENVGWSDPESHPESGGPDTPLGGGNGCIWMEVVPGFCSEWEDCELGSYTLG